MKRIGFIFVLCIGLYSSRSLAWGGRGHHLICDAATFLVKNEKLRQFLTARPQVMGHLCNVPDIHWRALSSEQTSKGNPGHYIDVEIIDLNISQIPLDYKALVKTYQDTENKKKPGVKIKNFASEFGSLWWRADQFYRRAIEFGKQIHEAAPPKGYGEQQDPNLKFNQVIYQMILSMGVMGHFVGDASQPFHATYDYDGYGRGHGGIHGFYEDEGVNIQDAHLISEVVTAAKKLQGGKIDFLLAGSVIEKMKALSSISQKEIEAIYAIDPIIKESSIVNKEGKEVKMPAERKSIKNVGAKFKPMIVSQMARSAALLAKMWDEVFEKSDSPDLAPYKSYQYPFTPEFVPPDYL